MFGTRPKTKAELLRHAGPAVASAKLAGRNTLLIARPDGARTVQLHATPILTIRPDGRIEIETGGWNTHTTRARLNAYLPRPWRVHTHQGTIYLRNFETGAEWPFRQSVTVFADGRVNPDLTPADVLGDRKRIDRFMRHVKKTGLPRSEDSLGDPWVIMVRVDSSVMWDWIDTLYFTRVMYGLALRHAGLTDAAIGYFMHAIDRRGGKLDATDLRRVRRFIRASVGMEN